MKGRIIEPDEVHEEDSQLGIGLECPDCGESMKKITRLKVNIQAHKKDETVVEQEPSVTSFVCERCGYSEDIIPEEPDAQE